MVANYYTCHKSPTAYPEPAGAGPSRLHPSLAVLRSQLAHQFSEPTTPFSTSGSLHGLFPLLGLLLPLLTSWLLFLGLSFSCPSSIGLLFPVPTYSLAKSLLGYPTALGTTQHYSTRVGAFI